MIRSHFAKMLSKTVSRTAQSVNSLKQIINKSSKAVKTRKNSNVFNVKNNDTKLHHGLLDSLPVFALDLQTRMMSTKANQENMSTYAADNKKLEYYRAKDDIENSRPDDWDTALPFEKIPGPPPSKFIGNSWRFIFGELAGIPLADLHEKFYKDYGDIMILKDVLGRSDLVFLYSPDEIEKMYRNEGVWPIRDQMKVFQYYRTKIRGDVFGEFGGLTTLQGEDWFKMRTIANSILMQPRNAQIYLKSMNTVAEEFVDLMKSYMNASEIGEMPSTFGNDINKWSLESMGVIALDKHLGCLKQNLDKDSHPQKMIDGMVAIFNMMFRIEVLPSLWKIYPTKDFKKFVEIMDFFTYTILDLIKEAKERLDKSGSEPSSAFERMVVKNEKIATAMCIDMMMAGIDTTGKTLSAALYYLSSNKRAQDELRKEIKKLLPSKTSEVTKETLINASYLKAVIKETTRLAPIAVGNARSTQKDMVLCGYQIPKGTQVLMNHMYLCKRDENFVRAKEFLPERFLRSTQGELSSKNTHPFVFQPFGFGSRSCIGKRLANLELEVALAKIVRNFELHWAHEEAIFESHFLYGIASPLKYQLKEVAD